MSLVPASSKRAKSGAQAVGLSPRVQLLPATVKARERVRQARRMLVLGVILAAVVVAGVNVYAVFDKTSTEADLLEAQNETATLLAEQSQYTEGVAMAGRLALIEQAQTALTVFDVPWFDFIGAIDSRMPEGVSFVGLEAASRAPWEPPMVPDTPLRGERIATMTLTLNSGALPEATQLYANLADLPGFVDATITESRFEDGVFVTKLSLALNEEAVRLRFGDAATDPAPITEEAAQEQGPAEPDDAEAIGDESAGDVPAENEAPAEGEATVDETPTVGETATGDETTTGNETSTDETGADQ